MTHRGESAILRRVESLVRQLLDEMLAERGIGGAWDAAGEGSAPLDRTVTEPDGSSSSGSKARQLDALVRDLEREAPVTTRALPYPPDPVEVAADLLAELLACYRLAGWDPVETGPTPLVSARIAELILDCLPEPVRS